MASPFQPEVAGLGHRVVDLGRREAVKLRVWTSRWRLDEELIAGADPNSRSTLAARAEQLRDLSYRRRRAGALERLIEKLDAPQPQLSSAVPFDHDQVARARGELLALANALRTARSIDPSGVALVDKLLRDPSSPLYARTPEGALQLEARKVRHCLLGE